MSRPYDGLVPAKANRDLGALHITSTWAIADSTHFRIEAKTSSPPLETQTWIYAAEDGKSEIWYSDIAATAIRMPLPTKGSSAAGPFLTGGALPPVAGSIQKYVDQYNHPKSRVHARLVVPGPYGRRSRGASCLEHDKHLVQHGRARQAALQVRNTWIRAATDLGRT
jgi:hypothetical protein